METSIIAIHREREEPRRELEFASMLSHELKNPLSAILLNTAYIRRSVAREQTPSEKELRLSKQIETIEHSALRINELLGNFLDLAQIESGSFTLDPQSYRVKTLVNDAIEASRSLALSKGIQISQKIEINEETSYFDRQRIYQVLSYLVGNAVSLSPENSEVTIQLRQLEDGLLFSVSDDAPEAPKNQKSHILALKVAKGIVEAHCGKLWSENTSSRGGCTFFFSVCLKQPAPALLSH